MLREVLGILDVLLRERHPAVRPLAERLSSASSCVGAQQTWTCSCVGMAAGSLPASRAPSRNLSHSMSIFSSAAPTVMIPSAYLPVRLAFTGPAVATRIGHRLLRDGVEPRRLEREVLAVVLDDLAAEELADDLDGLEHHRAADPDLRPLAADDVLVQRLAGAKAQPEAARVHGAQRGRRVGDHGRVVAEARAGHRGAEGSDVRCPSAPMKLQAKAAWPCCGVHGWKCSLTWKPALEAGRFRLRAQLEQLGGVELLEHAGVTDLRHAHSVPSDSRCAWTDTPASPTSSPRGRLPRRARGRAQPDAGDQLLPSRVGRPLMTARHTWLWSSIASR